MWEIEFTEQFESWWDGLTIDQQEALDAGITLLSRRGPALGRPLVDVINGSRHKNLKELRVSQAGALRVLFAFDPRRTAILLIGGDKSGQWHDWYRTAIATADDLYDQHLAILNEEGLI